MTYQPLLSQPPNRSSRLKELDAKPEEDHDQDGEDDGYGGVKCERHVGGFSVSLGVEKCRRKLKI